MAMSMYITNTAAMMQKLFLRSGLSIAHAVVRLLRLTNPWRRHFPSPRLQPSVHKTYMIKPSAIALGKLRQESRCMFKASLGYKVKSCLTRKKKGSETKG